MRAPVTGPLRVAVVDDHRLLAQSVALALRAAGHAADVLTPGGDVPAAVAALGAQVVVLDLHLGAADPRGGDRLVGELAPGAAVLVVTAETDRARWGRCLRAGAAAVVSKESAVEEVVAAVEDVAAGRRVVPDADRLAWLRAAEADERASAARLAPFRELTPREREVLDALVEGHPAADIARTASVTEATVRTQIRAVLLKLGVRSQLQAAAAARRAGWPLEDVPA
jgi:DNA-binding NarL/FixJ family response regulator